MTGQRRIVAIGGGEMKARETLAIDREVVGATGVARPVALFIPTASDDSEPYWQSFQEVYGRVLGCRTAVIRLIADPPPPVGIEAAIRAADLIYVGGGNTLRMMRRWRRLGVDRLLLDAHARGVVLAGLSAGALCWFRAGHSDSMSFYHPTDWDYIRVRCLGLLPATACPHYDGERRDEDFQRMIGRTGGIGIALDDGCALQVVDDDYRVLVSKPGAGAYRVRRRRGRVVQEPIPQREAFTPLGDLLAGVPLGDG